MFFYFIFCVIPVISPGFDLNPKCLIIPKRVKKTHYKVLDAVKFYPFKQLNFGLIMIDAEKLERTILNQQISIQVGGRQPTSVSPPNHK